MLTLLSQQLRECGKDTLWIADENSKPLLTGGLCFAGTLLSNRWDLVEAAKACGIDSYFNDFDLDAITGQFSRIVYPVSKEKAAVHHIINTAPRFLAEGGEDGELLLLGSKSSGIKTYSQKTALRFGSAKNLKKHGNDYLSVNRLNTNTELGPLLDDSDYSQLRPLDILGGLYSKPGQFGWNKIDVGSALLASHFEANLPNGNTQVVDLGCGYGYLSAQLIATAKHPEQINIQATDNNTAAILACQKNFLALGISGTVSPGDAGSEITSNCADLLICNPPFHQGFQVEGDLTVRFLNQAARILRPQGIALFVVNEFIPLNQKAQGLFAKVALLNKEKGFCIYRLKK